MMSWAGWAGAAALVIFLVMLVPVPVTDRMMLWSLEQHRLARAHRRRRK